MHAIGLDIAKGMTFIDGLYWDADPETRAWSKRFYARRGVMPTMAHAGVYSAVKHYLGAVHETGTDDAHIVAAKMRELPVNDFFAKGGRIRADGRLVHDMYLVQVKQPAQSSNPGTATRSSLRSIIRRSGRLRKVSARSLRASEGRKLMATTAIVPLETGLNAGAPVEPSSGAVPESTGIDICEHRRSPKHQIHHHNGIRFHSAAWERARSCSVQKSPSRCAGPQR